MKNHLSNIYKTLLCIFLYLVIGYAGLSIAIHEGYASPVFPAAGLAVAFTLLWGNNILYGVFIGSFFLHILIAYQSAAVDFIGISSCLLIATGATIQTFFARFLTLFHLKKNWRRLTNDRDILIFLFVIAPISCIISASIGVTTLYYTNIIQGSDYVFSYWNWWLGDTLGVSVFTPLVLLFMQKKISVWRNRQLFIAVPMSLIILITGIVFYSFTKWDHQQQIYKLEQIGKNLSQDIGLEFNTYKEILSGVSKLIEVNQNISQNDFDYYSKTLLNEHKEILSFALFQKTSESFNQKFMSYLASNSATLGQSINLAAIKNGVIDNVSKLKTQPITSQVNLKDQENESFSAILILSPIYIKESLWGVSLAVLQISEFFKQSLAASLPEGVVLQLSETQAMYSLENTRNYFKEFFKSSNLFVADLQHSIRQELFIVDKLWEIKIIPTVEYLQKQRSSLAWFIGIVVLLFASLLQVILLSITGKNYVIQRKVSNQTKKLMFQSVELERLLESQKLFGAAVHQTESSIVITDSVGNIVFVNQAFSNLTGYEKEDVIGKNPRILKPDGEGPALYKELWETISNKKTWKGEFHNKNKNGELFWELATISPVLDEQEQITHFVGVKENITKRKQQEEELKKAKLIAEEASSVKDKFLAKMSHEIRTPMNSILGMTEVLDESPLNDEQKKHLRVLKKSGENLLMIVNDILDLTKFEMGNISLNSTIFFLPDVIKDIVDLMGPRFIDQNNNIVFDINDNVNKYYKGDAYRIKQVLMNLLGNANKFTDNGTIKISVLQISEPKTELEDCDIRFVIEDSGIGISSDKIEKLFIPFSQEDEAVTRRYGGTGLGLVICKKIIEMMDGNISLTSQKNVGTTITFTISIPQSGEPVLSHTDNNCLKKLEDISLRILLVDDSIDNRWLVKAFLKKTKHSVVEATNGKEAFQLVQQMDFDLVFMDIQMPVMDGNEATKKIREWEIANNRKPLMIYALTGYALKNEKEKSLASGHDAHLTKPIQKRELMATLEDFVKRNKLFLGDQDNI